MVVQAFHLSGELAYEDEGGAWRGDLQKQFLGKWKKFKNTCTVTVDTMAASIVGPSR